ncbi:hypothetical protein HDU67_009238 [Dinochytrium kinnereticum]|nr:hypothetical protein HDU67_009238 [Dinochytrium kinnereticum]
METRKKPWVLSCCGCIPLRAGVITVSTLNLISIVWGIGQIISVNFKTFPYNPYGITAYYVIIGAYEFIGFYGAIRNNVKLAQVYAIWSWFAVFLYTGANLSFLETGLQASLRSATGSQGAFFAVVVVSVLLQIYFCVCIWSYYTELRDFPERYAPESPVQLQVVAVQAPVIVEDIKYTQGQPSDASVKA